MLAAAVLTRARRPAVAGNLPRKFTVSGLWIFVPD